MFKKPPLVTEHSQLRFNEVLRTILEGMNMSRVVEQFRKKPHWLALIIFVVLCLWVLSGAVNGENATADPTAEQINRTASLQRVKTTLYQADQINQEIKVYGRTEPNRITTLRAEVSGQVLNILVAEGHRVKAGQPLVQLDENDLRMQLASVNASLKQAQLELKGARSLGEQGFQSQVAQAQAEASLASAKAQQTTLQLALENTVIKAPFDGVMDTQNIEVGDYLREGDNIGTVVDLDPLIIKADITETHVQQLNLGQQANGRLVSGQALSGELRYIASFSEPSSNTFKVEVAVANADNILRAGMSAELKIPLQETWAVKITPAVLALDEKGNLGVKTVRQDRAQQNIVHFVPIDMVKSDSDGVWLTGLGREANIITLGQGFVREGDRVEIMPQNEPQNASIALAQEAQ